MLYIHSPNHFDETALRIMGLSAKVNDNSIGRFGTGLKYAVAIILRTGGEITIERRSAPAITFRTSDAEFRGKAFVGIEMDCGNGWEKLPFTTDYGRDWDLWKAYRELVSNAYDEGGDVSDSLVADETVLEVRGLDEARKVHDLIFLAHERKVMHRSPNLELSAGVCQSVYYRNIRGRDFPKPIPMQVNILREINLTEDRTIANEYQIRSILEHDIKHLMTEQMVEECFRSRLWDNMACSMSSYDTPSEAFISTAKTSTFVPNNVASWLTKHNERSNQFRPRQMSSTDEAFVESALAIVRKLMPDASRDELTFVNKLVDAHGLYDSDSGNIYIAATTFSRGRDHLAATIYEELCHKHYGYQDESRSFQEHLLQTLIGMATRV